MEEILSNAEIDALLDLFQNEGMPEELEEAESLDFSGGESQGSYKVSELDLLKPNRFTRAQLQVLARIQEMVSRKMGSAIAERLRLDASCDCVGVEQLRFSSWLSLLDNPTGTYVLQMDPLRFPSILTVSPELLYGAVDRILGGTGEVHTCPQDLSEAEYEVADALLQPLLVHIQEGLGEMVQVEPKVIARYTNPTLAQVLPAQEVILALHFQVSGNPLFGDLRLAVPYAALEPHLGALESSRFLSDGGKEGAYRNLLTETVLNIPMGLKVLLGEMELKLRDILALKTGDVLSLTTKPGDLLNIPVQGKTKFRGVLGTRGRRYATKILEVVHKG
ncbi:MAG TPA: flagellar motor switch protein FliM [Planctomycetes bacterium]|nr:flagellar motor switch protein FliM [Planctomycetota bacterium]